MEIGGDKRSSMPHRQFGQLLLNARRRCELSQSELARRSGVKQSLLSNVEAGRRRATDPLLEAVAPHLQVQPDRLKELRDFVGVGGSLVTGVGNLGYLRGEHDRDPRATAGGGERFAELADAMSTGTGALLALWQAKTFGKPPPAHAGSWLDQALEYMQLADPAGSSGPPRSSGPSKRLSLLRSVVASARELDEKDLRRVDDFIAGMRASRERPPD